MRYKVGDKVKWINHGTGGWLKKGQKYIGTILSVKPHEKFNAVYAIRCDNSVRAGDIPEEWIQTLYITEPQIISNKCVEDYVRAMRGI